VRYDGVVSPRREPLDDDVPRLPRGRGITLSRPQLIKIAFTAALLVAVIVLTKPCAEATGKFVGGFDNPDAAPASPTITRPDQLDVPGSSGVYVDLKGLTPEQQEAAIAKARKEAEEKLRGSAGSGSSTSTSSGSGSGSGSSAP
jgi:hypothetical protein